MKKVFILSILLLLCVGCTRIDNQKSYDMIIDSVIKEDKKANTVSTGYKYYLPLGVTKVYDNDYNQKLKTNDTFLYLYVDIVSYYHHNNINLNDNEANNYYKLINNGNKTGYIKIVKQEDKNFIKIVYNYAKIESYAKESELEDVIAKSMIILDSIDYNEKLIKNKMENDLFSSVDKEYKIKKPEDAKSKFSEYLNEYVQDEENVVPDLPEY